MVCRLVKVRASFRDLCLTARARGVDRAQRDARVTICRPILGYFRFTRVALTATRDMTMGLSHQTVGQLCFEDSPFQWVDVVRRIVRLLTDYRVVSVILGRRVSGERARGDNEASVDLLLGEVRHCFGESDSRFLRLFHASPQPLNSCNRFHIHRVKGDVCEYVFRECHPYGSHCHNARGCGGFVFR